MEELIDAVAVDLSAPGVISDNRLDDKGSLLETCPGLIELVYGEERESIHHHNLSSGDVGIWRAHDDAIIVQIAHFSVQEYLISDRIRQGKASRYALSDELGHADIAKVCVAQLIDPTLHAADLSHKDFDAAAKESLKSFPLARYAAQWWHTHYVRAAIEEQTLIDGYILRLLGSDESLDTWVWLHRPDNPWENLRPVHYDVGSPIYYASYMGLPQVLRALISGRGTDDINDSSNGFWRTALHAAAYEGHETVVQILLNADADVNAKGRRSRTPLSHAASGNHLRIVRMLLDAGADVRSEVDDCHDDPICAAADSGHEKVVQMLLDAGAEINANSNKPHKSPLQIAAESGHEKVVQVLLGAGAQTYTGALRPSPLQIASWTGYEEITRMLLDAGAGVDGGHWKNGYMSPLYAASNEGYEKIVRLLLDAGAKEDNHPGRLPPPCPLQVASKRGHEGVVRMLLDAGVGQDPGCLSIPISLELALENNHIGVAKILRDAATKRIHFDGRQRTEPLKWRA